MQNLATELSRCVKLQYMKLEALSTVFFVIFMLTFLMSRLLYYPFIIHSCHFRGPGFFFNRNHDLVENSLTGLLTALYPIHLYWFFLIIKVAIKAIRGNINDSRSDSDEEEEAPNKKTQ